MRDEMLKISNVYYGTHIWKRLIYVWREPIYVRTSFYIQLIFSCSVYVSHHFLVIPNRKYGHTCMAHDWVATTYVWIFFYFLFTYFACLYEYWQILLVVWKALYVSGHTINDQIRTVTRRNCVRTCLVTFQLTRHVWLRNANAFVCVWTSLSTDQMHMVTRRKRSYLSVFFFNWPDAYGHATQFLARMGK